MAKFAYDRVVSSTADRPHHPVLGSLFKLASVVFLSGLAACVKYLGAAIPVGQTIFFRGAISLVVLALVAAATGGLHRLKTDNWRAHAGRSLAGTASMFCWFTALSMIPFADATIIGFTVPMFLTILAMLILGERIHRYRWTALALGCLGVVVMIGPHVTLANGSALGVSIGLLAAVSAAFALMFLRSMSGHEHAVTITFYFFLTSTVCAGLTALAGWPWPTRTQWIVLVSAGLLGVCGQLLMTYSYRYAEASTIAPLEYSSLIVAVTIGYFVFGEIPYLSTWIGAPLVIIAGLIILWREYQIQRRAPGLSIDVAAKPIAAASEAPRPARHD